ncbi:sugar phosphate isomerase/epimerase family protein [Tautonia rosea]|uniref:sugar phosphate isomerase/epimerase family protein n=1 Tax=Tautonia rosea TaxID=2728037 RepID=UPI0014767E89|nr:sugar phosphate isomerase/epimerase [Tautonia rosea]
MRIGLDCYTVIHRSFSPNESLAFAESLQLEGVQFLEPCSVVPDLAPDRLAELRRDADARCLYLEIGLPSPNPFGQLSPTHAPIDPLERATWFRPHLEAVAALGLSHARIFIGNRHDRFRTDPPWPEQCEAASRTLRAMRADLIALGLRLGVETHADLTCDELLTLIDTVGDDVLGVTLDTGNLPMRLDDPLRAAERLAPLVVMTHLKDAALAFTDRGLCWQARPVGEGCIPIAAILNLLHQHNPALNLSIELHPRTYDLPIFDPTWLACFPSLEPASLAAVVRLAVLCERRYTNGSMPHPDAVEALPWPDRADTWIKRSASVLRSILPTS